MALGTESPSVILMLHSKSVWISPQPTKKKTRLPYPTVVSHLYMDVHFSTVSLCFIEKYMAVGQQDWEPAFKDQDELYLMRCSTSTYPTEVEH